VLPFLLLCLSSEAARQAVARRHNMCVGTGLPLSAPFAGGFLTSLAPMTSYPPSRSALFDVSVAGK
jgi:hypothetical protein